MNSESVHSGAESPDHNLIIIINRHRQSTALGMYNSTSLIIPDQTQT